MMKEPGESVELFLTVKKGCNAQVGHVIETKSDLTGNTYKVKIDKIISVASLENGNVVAEIKGKRWQVTEKPAAKD